MDSHLALRKAQTGDKTTMRAMLAKHLREMRAFGPVEEPYPYFDVYWTETTRWPYLIEVAGKPIGFVMVNRWSPSGRGTEYAIGEFYIDPDHRRLGHGMEAARRAFRAHPGQWELSIYAANRPAQAFWPAAITSAGGRSLERFVHRGNSMLRFVIGGDTRARTASKASSPASGRPRSCSGSCGPAHPRRPRKRRHGSPGSP